jgi:hypothetical protein
MAKKYLYLLLFPLLTLVACGGETKVDVPDEVINDGTVEAEIDPTAINKVIAGFSSPIEMAASIESMDIPYSQKILVPTSASDNFDSNFKKAVGLGMFSADLGYLNVYKKTNTIIEYLTSIKKLADDLDVDQFFDFQTLKRLATSSDNLDSLMYMSVSSHNRMDEHLRASKRSDLSALMVTGVWVEGIYLAAAVSELKQTKEMRDKIGDQKNILSDLYFVLKFFEKRPHFKDLITEFDALKEAYEGVTITTKPGETKTYVDKDGVTVTESGEETVVEMTDEQYTEITENIKKIRNKLISL